MNKYLLKTKHGITPAQLRKQFYTAQNRRCVICDNEVELGHGTVYDTPSKKVLCRKCGMLVRAMRAALGVQLDRAMALVVGGDNDDAKNNSCAN